MIQEQEMSIDNSLPDDDMKKTGSPGTNAVNDIN